ncbi:MAG: hypothetical protein AUJ72_02160 [Candidatus Omnitrophica bacterium CG1_02_46_14]|nr:MAG: hypothetical protein AUJ72_02160 [Candidatus Omnitrophica bacterium CG1_02_46_14]
MAKSKRPRSKKAASAVVLPRGSGIRAKEISPRLRFVWIALGLGLAIRIAYLVASQKSPFFQPLLLDPEYYHRWAQRIVAGDWVGDPVFYGLPLYPFFLALCYKLFSGSLMAVKIVQAALGLVTLFFIYKIGEKIASRRAGILAIFLGVFYGPLFFHEGVLIPETLSLPLYAASLYLAMIFFDSPTISKGITLGVLTGLAALTKAGVIPFVFLLSALSVWTYRKKGLFPAISVLFAFVLTLAPVTAHNFIFGKDRVLLTSHSGFNFYIGNNPKAEGVFVAPEGVGSNVDTQIADARAVAERELKRDLKPSEVSRYWSDKAWDFIRSNPLDFFKLCLKKLVLFFDAREISDVDDYAFCANFNPMLRFPWLNFAILGPLFLAGAAGSFRTLRYRILVYPWILSYLIGILFFFVNARYRLPLLSIFFPIAAVGLIDLYDNFKKSSWVKVGAWTAACLIGVAISEATLVDKNHAPDYVNAGDAESKMNDTDQAMALYKKALEMDPGLVKANQAMGVLYSRLGDEDTAKTYYEKTLAEDPDSYQSHNNIGLWYDRKGYPGQAKSHFLKAIELKPNSAQAHNNLGMVYGKEGENDLALKEFAESLKLNPYNAKTHTNLGLILYRFGRIDEARREWETALQIDPDFKEAKRAMALLKNRL